MSKENHTKMTKIEKFIIEIDGKTLELTPAQAAELRDILVTALGQKPEDFAELKKMIEDLQKKQKEKEPIPFVPYPVWPKPWQPWEPLQPRRLWEPIWIETKPVWTSGTSGPSLTNGTYSSGTLQITCKK